MGRHVAVKCTYNDGGEGAFVGFNGTCSDKTIAYNILKRHHVWCSQKRCLCSKHLKRNFQGRRPTGYICNEAVLFKNWSFGTGGYQTGERAGEAIYARDIEIGKIAILTTRFPEMDSESERKIIGFFKIDDLDDLLG